MAHHGTSKGAILSLTRTGQEFGPHGISVNNIPPGSILNMLTFESLKGKGSAATSRDEKFLNTVSVRRAERPKDVAQTCAWLVSDEASYVTGQTMCVNEGEWSPS